MSEERKGTEWLRREESVCKEERGKTFVGIAVEQERDAMVYRCLNLNTKRVVLIKEL